MRISPGPKMYFAFHCPGRWIKARSLMVVDSPGYSLYLYIYKWILSKDKPKCGCGVLSACAGRHVKCPCRSTLLTIRIVYFLGSKCNWYQLHGKLKYLPPLIEGVWLRSPSLNIYQTSMPWLLISSTFHPSRAQVRSARIKRSSLSPHHMRK
jgi:hypothetical protein